MTTEIVLKTRPLPRALKNMGIDLDEGMTEGLIEMLDLAYLDTFIEEGSDTPGISYMTRYVIDKDAPVFDKTEYGIAQKDWETVEVLEGVIIDIKPYRAKRKNRGYVPDEENPTECASPDMITGIGDPGGECRGCRFAEWPTDEEKKNGLRSPWCGDRWRVFFKNESEIMPQYLDLPGGYKSSLENYRRELKKRGAQTWQVVTQMEVRQTDNKTFLDCDIIGSINSEDEQVTTSISAMQVCIAACIVQYAGWHLRYQGARKHDSDNEYPNKQVEGTAQDPQTSTTAPPPPRPVPIAPPSLGRQQVILDARIDVDGSTVWVNEVTREVFNDEAGRELLYVYDDPDAEKVTLTPDDVSDVADVLGTSVGTNSEQLEAQQPVQRAGKLGALAAARQRNRA